MPECDDFSRLSSSVTTDKPGKTDPFSEKRKKISAIWAALAADDNEYDQQKVITLMKEYADSRDRILYSVISNHAFKNADKNDIIEVRLNDIISSIVHNNDTHRLDDFLTRFYDHVHLVFVQQRNIHATDDTIADLKKEVAREKRKIRKEYTRSKKENVAILGIFSAIVVSITGVLSFSGNVISNLKDVDSIYSLSAVGLVLMALLLVIDLFFHLIKGRHMTFAFICAAVILVCFICMAFAA